MPYKNIEDYKLYRKKNKEKYRGYEKKYKQNNKQKTNEYSRKYRETHPRTKELTEKQKQARRDSVRKHTKYNIKGKISNNLRVRIRLSLKGKTKSKHTLELLGCSIEFLKQWLSDKFTEGMTWENYGRGKEKWGIDHKIPCSNFDLSNRDEQLKCFNYSNLQPMWCIDNSKKNNKI
jgi:hypothetical protein